MLRLRALGHLRRGLAPTPAWALQAQRGMAAQPAPAPAEDLIEVTVDGKTVQVPKGSNVMQACDAAGVDVPRFCYHQRLSVAGNCRMCLVEIEKAPKPVASCAFPAGPGMVVKTTTERVKKAREGVMEFLLINHPLDCPICDQGGECDLQDQAMSFGSDRGRHTEPKRGVVDKNLGPLVKTVMTRCIHCTRCVRFAKEVAGIEDLGVTGRGRDAEIGTYVQRVLTSELSGNVIDLCPVGALTSKPGAFTFRSWETVATESVDVSDALGSQIRVDSRGPEVFRVTPRLADHINEEWISDKARFQYDALRYQRLAEPLLRGPDGRLRAATWREALAAAAAAVKAARPGELAAVAGKLADAESLVALKDLVNALGSGDHSTDAGYGALSADLRGSFLFNSTIQGVSEADRILLVGTNPRREAPVLNARIRASAIAGVPVKLLGEDLDLTYAKQHVGTTAADLAARASDLAAWLAEGERPLVLVGASAFERADAPAVASTIASLAEAAKLSRPEQGWNGLSYLHDSASRAAALELGFVKSAAASAPDAPKPGVVYLLGADDWTEEQVPEDAFVIYQGHTGERGASRADVVLPSAAYTEKAATYLNTEGRPQRTRRAVPPPGEARDDWKIVRALAEVAGVTLPYDDVEGVRARLAEVSPAFARVGRVESALPLQGLAAQALAAQGAPAPASDEPFRTRIDNFYQTDVLSRASKTMARCVKAVSTPFPGRALEA